MRHNYVGDEGDYYKFALLRFLCGEISKDSLSQLSLGIVWYLYTWNCNDADGKKRSYIENQALRHLDDRLFNHLCEFNRMLNQGNHRNLLRVEQVRERKWITPRAVFFEDDLTYKTAGNEYLHHTKRESHRDKWLRNANSFVKDCNIVFLDPDNGFAGKKAEASKICRKICVL